MEQPLHLARSCGCQITDERIPERLRKIIDQGFLIKLLLMGSTRSLGLKHPKMLHLKQNKDYEIVLHCTIVLDYLQ